MYRSPECRCSECQSRYAPKAVTVPVYTTWFTRLTIYIFIAVFTWVYLGTAFARIDSTESKEALDAPGKTGIVTLGSTSCNAGGARVWIMTEGRGYQDVASTIIHEGTHVLQCKRMGADIFTYSAGVPILALPMEAEAFAVQHTLDGMSVDQCSIEVTYDLLSAYPGISALGYKVVAAESERQCAHSAE